MGGFSLDGYYGRVPCPHCGSIDCAGFSRNHLICCYTKGNPIVSETALRQSAQKHNMTTYRTFKESGWELHEFTYVNEGFEGHFKISDVELYNEDYGVRGVCPNLKIARAFAKANKNNWSAYYKSEERCNYERRY